MKSLQDKILKEGCVLGNDILKVDNFLNHQLDVAFLNENENILVLDDFLANGRAALGLKDLVNQAGANLVGVGIVIEKGFQDGRQLLENQGIKLESLAILDSIENGTIKFI